MYIILGGTGNVGSSVAENLIEQGKEVTIVTRNTEKASEWQQRGAKTAIVDVNDTGKLSEVFNTGKRLFLLNPPADPESDTVTEERRTLSSIIIALENSEIEKVVAESTYGAQPGEGIGDLGVLFDMEQRLEKMKMPAVIIRAAYYMSNWDASLETAQKEGLVYTFYPTDFKLPMAAPKDIGKIAAHFLTEPIEKTGVKYVEGPVTYSSDDVAGAFGKVLNKTVRAVQIPEDQWLSTLKQVGFSDTSARSMAAMTKITLEDNYEKPHSPIRGETRLDEYFNELVSKTKK